MLKLNVGFNKKVGEANYGSRGAGVNLELEVDSSLVGNADRLKERIRHLFRLAKNSVAEELADVVVLPADGDGAANGIADGRPPRRDGIRAATASQQRALSAISERHGIDLFEKLQAMYGVRESSELTIFEASELIDELKSLAGSNGHGG